MTKIEKPLSSPDLEPRTQMDDYTPTLYIGYHESKSTQPVTESVFRMAQAAGYDMLTTPITTEYFQTRVLDLVSNYLSELQLSKPFKETLTSHRPVPIIPPLAPIDSTLRPGETSSQLIAYSSPWVDLDSEDPLILNISRQVLNLEIAYASFCGVGYIIIPGPRLFSSNDDRLIKYARAIQEALTIGNFTQIAIQIPMYSSGEFDKIKGDLAQFSRHQKSPSKIYESKEMKLFESWDAWNLIRTVCKYNTKLSVALEIPRQLPIDSLQSRWYAEPLRILLFASSIFLKNKGGHPVLSKSHQSLITRYIRQKIPPWIILCDVELIPNLIEPKKKIPSDLRVNVNISSSNFAEKSNSTSPLRAEAAEFSLEETSSGSKDCQGGNSHLTYLRHLQNNQPARTTIEIFGSGYQDYLQAPLQPLTDNLESVTYEVFEKDPVKYDWYERAIIMALSDWSRLYKPTSSSTGAVVIAVAGSGRGPLVTRAIRASKITGVPIELWAVEKNPNAFVLLQRYNEEEWGGVVNVVKSDMRAWKGPLRCAGHLSKDIACSQDVSLETSYGRVDIIVSELLGSFADNELSPECLDGVQHVLATEYGISIPSSYTAHLTPISAPRLYAEISHRAILDDTATETPYVVLLNAIDFLASSVPHHPRIQKAWEFTHPLPKSTLEISTARRGGGVSGGGGGSMSGGDGANEHNVRAAKSKFICKDRGVVHGIAGYFEAVLYDGGEIGKVELSTRPDTMGVKSKDMISWFPIYFPLKNALYIPDDSELEVSIWRQTDDRKVWYEWLVEAFVMVGPENRKRLGISEMGSSRKVGCLM